MSDVDRVAIEVVSRALAELRDNVMFLGGMAAGFLITDPAVAPLRTTDDVDLVVDVAATYTDELRLSKRLRELGFAEDSSEGAPRCRWLIRGIKVDVMPPTEDRWYPEALANAQSHEIAPDLTVKVISPAYFLATKLEAFGDGRRGDYFSSHDLEDVIAVVDGRSTIEADVLSSPPTVRIYLAERFKVLLGDRDFLDAVAGHLPGDSASQARLPLVVSRIRAIAAAASTLRAT
jgi:hypothetical protein